MTQDTAEPMAFPTDLASDPRWRRLTDSTFLCTCCNERVPGIFDIGYDHPDNWRHGNREKSGQPVLSVGEDALGADFCMHEDQFYLRCILPIPLIGSEKIFAFGPWASLSKDSMTRYEAAEESRDFGEFPQCFGWVSNLLPGCDMTEALPATVVFGDGTMRPEIWVHKGAHMLADWQLNGITLDQLLDIYAASGHDQRPHLLDS